MDTNNTRTRDLSLIKYGDKPINVYILQHFHLIPQEVQLSVLELENSSRLFTDTIELYWRSYTIGRPQVHSNTIVVLQFPRIIDIIEP